MEKSGSLEQTCCAALYARLSATQATLGAGELLFASLTADDFEPFQIHALSCEIPGWVCAEGVDLRGAPIQRMVPAAKIDLCLRVIKCAPDDEVPPFGFQV